MERIPSTPPKISPVPLDIRRPLWSVMIPAYNCSRYLSEAITSVLTQNLDWDNFQIEVVDDNSTDADVETLVKNIGQGKISYYRQPENVGSLRNFETCINRSKGYYVHLLHGDDKVKNSFYSKLTTLFNQFPSAGAAFCSYDLIDQNGTYLCSEHKEASEPCIFSDCLERLVAKQLLQVVTIAVRREVYEKLGCFYGVTYGEDWEMWARIAKNYPMAYTPECLAEYRFHGNSISGQSYISGQNIKDIIKISKVISSYLPVEKQYGAKKLLQQNYAAYIIRMLNEQRLNGETNIKISTRQFLYILLICKNINQIRAISHIFYLNNIKPHFVRSIKSLMGDKRKF